MNLEKIFLANYSYCSHFSFQNRKNHLVSYWNESKNDFYLVFLLPSKSNFTSRMKLCPIADNSSIITLREFQEKLYGNMEKPFQKKSFCDVTRLSHQPVRSVNN